MSDLKFEVGKTYQRRNGETVTLIRIANNGRLWVAREHDDQFFIHAADGTYFGYERRDGEHYYDLIAEYVPPVVEKRYSFIVARDTGGYNHWNGLQEKRERDVNPRSYTVSGEVEYTFTDGKLTGVRIVGEDE